MPSTNLRVDEGRNISFACNSSSSPASAVWTISDNSSFASNVYQLSNEVLFISSASDLNEKQYVCTLSNIAGNSSAPLQLAVTRKLPPFVLSFRQ